MSYECNFRIKEESTLDKIPYKFRPVKRLSTVSSGDRDNMEKYMNIAVAVAMGKIGESDVVSLDKKWRELSLVCGMYFSEIVDRWKVGTYDSLYGKDKPEKEKGSTFFCGWDMSRCNTCGVTFDDVEFYRNMLVRELFSISIMPVAGDPLKDDDDAWRAKSELAYRVFDSLEDSIYCELNRCLVCWFRENPELVEEESEDDYERIAPEYDSINAPEPCI